jgi:hypothetical protein
LGEKLRATIKDYEEMLKDLVYDEENQKLTFEGNQALITYTKTFTYTLDVAVETVGWDKTWEILYKNGYKICYERISLLGKRLGITGEELIKKFLKAINVRGWGFWEIVNLDVKTGKCQLRAQNLFWGVYFKEKGIKKYADTYFAGAIAGVIHGATGKKVKGKETKCIAMGDPYCEFIVEPE